MKSIEKFNKEKITKVLSFSKFIELLKRFKV